MKVLMVCLGNICRSPMAEGILRHKVNELGLDVSTDSAGTAGYHVGESPDHRAVTAMQRHGIDITDLRARQFIAEDYDQFDLIFAMDQNNYSDMLSLASSEDDINKLRLILDLNGSEGMSVPDPYFGGDEGFNDVHQMLDTACDVLIDEIRG